jgi:arylsulfatase A-like enzyme
MAKYYGMLSHLDQDIGRVLAGLDQAGVAENTLVIFAGDHGYSMASHGFVGKQCMYEEGIRLPLILRFPRQQRGAARCEVLASLVDFFPTICDAAGVDVPASVEGRSLLPLYRNSTAAWRDEIFASHYSLDKHGMATQCIRTRRYKLIQHVLTGEEELFDLAADPFELANLAEHPDAADVHAELAGGLAQWMATRNRATATASVERHE